MNSESPGAGTGGGFERPRGKKVLWEKDKLWDEEIIRATLSDRRIAGEATLDKSKEPMSAHRSKPLPELKNAPAQRGARLLALIDRAKPFRGSGSTRREVIEQFQDIPAILIPRLLKAPDFSEGMRKIIAEKDLGLASAGILEKFPPSLHAPIAEACSEGTLAYTGGRKGLLGVLYDVEKRGLSMLAALSARGFAWPDNLNDDGTPRGRQTFVTGEL